MNGKHKLLILLLVIAAAGVASSLYIQSGRASILASSASPARSRS